MNCTNSLYEVTALQMVQPSLPLDVLQLYPYIVRFSVLPELPAISHLYVRGYVNRMMCKMIKNDWLLRWRKILVLTISATITEDWNFDYQMEIINFIPI